MVDFTSPVEMGIKIQGLQAPTITSSYQATLSGGAVTAASPAVMAGLGVYFMPVVATRVKLKIMGSVATAAGGNGILTTLQVYYGTGTAPTGGAALTGTSTPQKIASSIITAQATNVVPFFVEAVVQGLTKDTPYWVDLSCLAASSSYALTFTSVNTICEEF